MDAVALLAQARAAGLRVAAVDGRLEVRGPRAARLLALRLLDRKPDIMAVLAPDDPEVRWRVEVMRRQIPASGAIPTLVARDARPISDGCCLSCGDLLPVGNRFNCAPCVSAAWQAIREVRG